VRGFFEWKARGVKAKSAPFARFAQELTRAKEDAIALCLLRHKQCGEGGVLELPKHDRAGRVKRDKEGNLVFEEVLMLPNPRALAQRLSWLAPERFGPKAQVNPTKSSSSLSAPGCRRVSAKASPRTSIVGVLPSGSPDQSFAHLSGESLARQTRWRSGVNSNCRYRFLNNQTTRRWRGSRCPEALLGSPEAQTPGRLIRSAT
jgi:hypothetical protein